MYDADHQCRLLYGEDAALCGGIQDLEVRSIYVSEGSSLAEEDVRVPWGFDNNNNNEILIKGEPLVYTRARRAVQKKKREKKRKKKKAWTVQRQ